MEAGDRMKMRIVIMRKTVSVLLTLVFIVGLLLGCVNTAAAEGKEIAEGALSLLNMTEEEYLANSKGKAIALKYLADQGAYVSGGDLSKRPEINRIIFYDTLTDMILALEAGVIHNAEIPQCTAGYLCAHNDRLVVRGSYHLEDADGFTKAVAYRLGVGYSFLLAEGKAGLRDELDRAISEMKEDGTLDGLVRTYILEAVSGDPEPVKFTKTDGETINVAVTGELPPMDYVAPDGTPAGFNTALLAELGKRLNKNFELVQVSSPGRSLALSSGNVDLAFWTNGQDGRYEAAGMSSEAYHEYVSEKYKTNSEEQNALMNAISGGMEYEKILNRDIPDGTITTQPYFSDMLVAVTLKK